MYATATTATTTSTAGNAAGYLQETEVQQGQSGTPIVVTEAYTYIENTVGEHQLLQRGVGHLIPPTPTGPAVRLTSYAYTYPVGDESGGVAHHDAADDHDGGERVQFGEHDRQVVYDNAFGNPQWTKDASGYLNWTRRRDTLTRLAVVKTITDVNTADTGTFTNLPGGWSTPTGGGFATGHDVRGGRVGPM